MVKLSVKLLGILSTAGMFIVLVMGAAVTNTGSEQGCGKDWPLCHGKLIPQMAVKTAIEFSHRAVVGVETVLIVAFAAGALYLFRRRREIQILTLLMVSFLFLQAGLGAWAVMYPQEAAILALHFGVSLVSFASVLLTAVYVFEMDSPARSADFVVPVSLRWFIWSLTLFAYVVVYLGAYVRHAHANLACKDWPLCNGAVIPPLKGHVATVFTHRVGAALLMIGIFLLVILTAQIRDHRPELFRAALLALVLVLAQALSGALVVWARLDLFSTLLHAALVGLMFGVLAYLCVYVLPKATARESSRLRSPRLRPEAETASVPR